MSQLELLNDWLKKQQPPGPPPREGLQWKPQTHRWIRPKTGQITSPSGMRIPPGWSDVWVTTRKDNPLQVVGIDSKGRKQSIYSTKHAGKQTAAKFAREKKFEKVYPKLMKQISSDLKRKEEAQILYLIAKTGFRIGSNKETFATQKAYGASTLLKSQIKVEGNSVTFDFIGKKGVRIERTIEDPILVSIIAKKFKTRGDSLFTTTDTHVRDYLHNLDGGAPFMVKDFRTRIGTITALEKIREAPPPPIPQNETQLKKSMKAIGEMVAKILGNTAAVALSAYIAPEVFAEWEHGIAPSAINKEDPDLSIIETFFESTHYDEPVENWENYEVEDPEEEDDFDDEENEIEKQAPPGQPPRPGLEWKPETHRWIRPEEEEMKPELKDAPLEGIIDLKTKWEEVSKIALEDPSLSRKKKLRMSNSIFLIKRLPNWAPPGTKFKKIEDRGFYGYHSIEKGIVEIISLAVSPIEIAKPTGLGMELIANVLEDCLNEGAHTILLQPMGEEVENFYIRLGAARTSKSNVLSISKEKVMTLLRKRDLMKSEDKKNNWEELKSLADEVGIELGSSRFEDLDKISLGLTIKQQPPGLPPREGLEWKPQTHRWIRPEEEEISEEPKVEEVPREIEPPSQKLIVSKHAWERTAERTGFRKMKEGLSKLKSKKLPDENWWYKVAGMGFLVGEDGIVKTVLALNMIPRGIELLL